MSDATAAPPRRGRPPKFGRPAQLITLTLPHDVVDWLKSLHSDPAWALVRLHGQATTRTKKPVALAELVPLPDRRALIMVNVEALRQLPGAAIIPLSDGRGLLALEADKGVADLELAVIDRLEGRAVPEMERRALQALRDRLREWRRQGVRFESRAIIVANRQGPAAAKPSSPVRRGR
ncbi:MAG: hypothetical protein OEW19_08870 [Acidobacteriota bacterium]|nr:hypothetical protein [Acidobacteriota bacterium]